MSPGRRHSIIRSERFDTRRIAAHSWHAQYPCRLCEDCDSRWSRCERPLGAVDLTEFPSVRSRSAALVTIGVG